MTPERQLFVVDSASDKDDADDDAGAAGAAAASTRPALPASPPAKKRSPSSAPRPSSSKRVRTRAPATSVVVTVLGTSLDPADAKLLAELGTRNGFRVASKFTSKVTHVVSPAVANPDASGQPIAARRTLKVLQGIAKGAWLLSPACAFASAFERRCCCFCHLVSLSLFLHLCLWACAVTTLAPFSHFCICSRRVIGVCTGRRTS